MKSFFVDVINHKFIFTFTILATVITGVVVAQNGMTLPDIAIVLGVGFVCFAVWRLLLTQSSRTIKTVDDFRNAVSNNKVPTLVQFYSPYCVGCMAAKPMVDQLEKDYRSKLQVYRLSIDEEPGASLMSELNVLFTPTFILFDKLGNQISGSVLMLDRNRIVHDLEHS